MCVVLFCLDIAFVQVVNNYEDLLSQATGIEALEGTYCMCTYIFRVFRPGGMPDKFLADEFLTAFQWLIWSHHEYVWRKIYGGDR